MSVRRLSTTIVATVAALLLAAGPAFAGHCTVANKPVSSGVQVVINGFTGEPVWISQGVQQQIDKFGIEHVEANFKGWIGLTFDGDATPEVSILIPGREGELGFPALPTTAYDNGPECSGVIDLHQYDECFDVLPF